MKKTDKSSQPPISSDGVLGLLFGGLIASTVRNRQETNNDSRGDVIDNLMGDLFGVDGPQHNYQNTESLQGMFGITQGDFNSLYQDEMQSVYQEYASALNVENYSPDDYVNHVAVQGLYGGTNIPDGGLESSDQEQLYHVSASETGVNTRDPFTGMFFHLATPLHESAKTNPTAVNMTDYLDTSFLDYTAPETFTRGNGIQEIPITFNYVNYGNQPEQEIITGNDTSAVSDPMAGVEGLFGSDYSAMSDKNLNTLIISAYNPGIFSTGSVGGLLAGLLNLALTNGANRYIPGHGTYGIGGYPDNEITFQGAYPNAVGWDTDNYFFSKYGNQNVSEFPLTPTQYFALQLQKEFSRDYNLLSNNCVDFVRERAALAGIDIPSFGIISTPAALAEWIKVQNNDRIVNTLVGYSWNTADQGIKPLIPAFVADNFDVSVRADIARSQNLSLYGEAGMRNFNEFSIGVGLEYKNFGFVPSFFGDVSYVNDINNPDSIRLRGGLDFSIIDAAVRLRATVSRNYYMSQHRWSDINYELGVHFQF